MNSSLGETTYSPPPSSFNHRLNFEVRSDSNNKVDILFVIDNSGSMAQEQAKIAQAFSGFISQISHMEWRIAITTTDNSSNVACKKGNLCPLITSSHSTQYFIEKTTPNVEGIFMQKIQQGTNGSGSEVGLTTLLAFLTNKKSDYQSFIRPEAAFVSIIVSDSNESSQLTASSFMTQMTQQLPADKNVTIHSSIAIPNDTSCTTREAYGVKYHDVSVATGGIIASICDENYGSQFQLFADSVIGKVAQKTLSCVPSDNNNDGQADIIIIGPNGYVTQYTLDGNTITFDPILESVGHYQVRYSCPQ